jgi:hypothetical protein
VEKLENKTHDQKHNSQYQKDYENKVKKLQLEKKNAINTIKSKFKQQLDTLAKQKKKELNKKNLYELCE